MSEYFSEPVLVHVGFPKALSSWLQKHWFHADNGFLTVMDPVAVQLNLIDPGPFQFDPAPAVSAMNIAKQGAATELVPVITSEALAGNMFCGGFNGKECIDRVAALAPQARVLLVVREQRGLIRSLYKALVTWGMPHSIERLLEPVEPRLSPQFNLDFLCFDQRVAYYQQCFGEDRVKVMPYEAFVDNPVGFLEDLAVFAGVAPSLTPIAEIAPVRLRVNAGQTLANLYLERWLNVFFLSGPFNYAGLMRPNNELWQKWIARFRRNPLPAFMDDWFEKSFAATVARSTQGQFAQSNARLQQLTGLDLAEFGYEL